MARIQFRDTTVYMQDGLSGAAAVNDVAGIIIGDLDVDIDAVVLNSTITDQVPVGARFTVLGDTTVYTVTARTPASGTTTNVTFTPAAVGASADDTVITFLPQRIAIKTGDGDITWNESREVIYDLDRDLLDTTRLGQEQPLEIDLGFTFEYVTTESGQEITPVDALKQTGEASEWVTSSSDLCEPYAVDIYAIHCVPCGSEKDEDYLFADFRWEGLDYSVQNATIAVSGKCNIVNAIVSRDNFTECA